MREQPKVAIIGTRGYPSYYGGFETAVRKLAPFLADQGWDVTVYGRPGATKDDDSDRDPRVHTKITAGLETKSLSTLTYGLSAIIDALWAKPDVALVMNVANGFWLPLLRLRGIRTVVNVDGIEWEREKWGRLAKTIFKLSAKCTALFGTQLVADAAEIQRRWLKDFRRESVFIPYGGDIPGELEVDPGQTTRGYILAVARFVPENTMPAFFEAVSTLAIKYRVVIVGSSGYGGDLDTKADQLSRKYENVSWLGHVSDDRRLLSLWQHAGAYFHGHSVGGTNPALVQAMACGAPIVARDTVYNREVLSSSAIFVEPTSTQIAKALDQTMKVSLSGQFNPTVVQDRARAHYSWLEVCKSYETALMSVSNYSGHSSKKSPAKI